MGTITWIIGAIIVFVCISSIAKTHQSRRVYVFGAAMIGGLMVVGGWIYDDHEEAVAKGYSGVSEMEAAESQKAKQEEEEKHRKGFHCLSAWDGSQRDLEKYVKDHLRDPDSYEHIETRIAPVSDVGTHNVAMQYRARNGFGGMTIGSATGVITNDGCKLVTASVE